MGQFPHLPWETCKNLVEKAKSSRQRQILVLRRAASASAITTWCSGHASPARCARPAALGAVRRHAFVQLPAGNRGHRLLAASASSFRFSPRGGRRRRSACSVEIVTQAGRIAVRRPNLPARAGADVRNPVCSIPFEMDRSVNRRRFRGHIPCEIPATKRPSVAVVSREILGFTPGTRISRGRAARIGGNWPGGVPSGASTWQPRSDRLRDGDKRRYGGRGTKAVEAVNT